MFKKIIINIKHAKYVEAFVHIHNPKVDDSSYITCGHYNYGEGVQVLVKFQRMSSGV